MKIYILTIIFVLVHGATILAQEEPVLVSSTEEQKVRHVLEDFVPLRQSHLWKLMMSFYDRKGPKSWTEGGVPNYVTSNGYIAKVYAEILNGFFEDCHSGRSEIRLDETKPLYIIELGSGQGKFSFHFFNAIMQLDKKSAFPLKNIVYVMTDFTNSNFEAWQSHPSLKPFFESGQLDAAIFNAVEDHSLTLHQSKVVLTAGSVDNPVVIVANYLFDTLFHDFFHIENSVLQEGLVSTGSTSDETSDPLNPDIIGRLDNRYQYSDITPNYYKEEEGDESYLEWMLTWYLDFFGEKGINGSVFVPLGALRALRRLTALSKQQSLVLSGDKGNANLDSFRDLFDIDIAVHGSFSVMVNYHAISLWSASHGGISLLDPHESSDLLVNAFIMSAKGGSDAGILVPHCSDETCRSQRQMTMNAQLQQLEQKSEAIYYNMRRAYKEYAVDFGPSDYLRIYNLLVTEQPTSIDNAIAALRLTAWDAEFFNAYSHTLVDLIKDLNVFHRAAIMEGLQLIFSGYYYTGSNEDIIAEIGRVYVVLREFSLAAEKYELFNSYRPGHHIGMSNLAMCYIHLGRGAEALPLLLEAHQIDPDFEDTKYWLRNLGALPAAGAEAEAAAADSDGSERSADEAGSDEL